MSKDALKGVLASLRKASGSSVSSLVADGTIGDIESYTDTGCHILNAQLSGDVYGGLPNGQVFTLAGESTTGKTFFSISIIENFLKQYDNGLVLIFDSENAINKNRLETKKDWISF